IETLRDVLGYMSGDLRRVLGVSVSGHEVLADTLEVTLRNPEVHVPAHTNRIGQGVALELRGGLDRDRLGRQQVSRLNRELCLVREQEEFLVERDRVLEDGHLGVRRSHIDRIRIEKLAYGGRVEVEELPRLGEDH